MEKRRLPKFRRQEWFRFKRLGEKWRKPRGRDSKLRLRIKGKGSLVTIGYRNPKSLRGLHPSGVAEVLVKSLSDLDKIDATKQAIRIAASVGGRKREQILKRAEELKIRVLNPGVSKNEAGREEKTGS
ncbi:MAG: 50S ribosomal protein L32e [Candidatus Hadarchaeum sp.]|uniref:50S ribosomal protein L32e n=1 Tax=Candidatus Hadarchaeum sp. TaxID=2883567 RepID=UPI003D0989E6